MGHSDKELWRVKPHLCPKSAGIDFQHLCHNPECRRGGERKWRDRIFPYKMPMKRKSYYYCIMQPAAQIFVIWKCLTWHCSITHLFCPLLFVIWVTTCVIWVPPHLLSASDCPCWRSWALIGQLRLSLNALRPSPLTGHTQRGRLTTWGSCWSS